VDTTRQHTNEPDTRKYGVGASSAATEDTAADRGHARPTGRPKPPSPKRAATRKRLIEAFFSLYAQKDIRYITVGELVGRAGCNRSTFYDHFHDVYEVLEEAEDEMLAIFCHEIMILLDLTGAALNGGARDAGAAGTDAAGTDMPGAGAAGAAGTTGANTLSAGATGANAPDFSRIHRLVNAHEKVFPHLIRKNGTRVAARLRAQIVERYTAHGLCLSDETRRVLEQCVTYHVASLVGMLEYWYERKQYLPLEDIFNFVKEVIVSGILPRITRLLQEARAEAET
jgi:AcrR family transcriptional regulator